MPFSLGFPEFTRFSTMRCRMALRFSQPTALPFSYSGMADVTRFERA